LNVYKDPLLCLSPLSGLIVIDEVQKIPGLFQTLRVLIDDPELDQKYLILASASQDLIQQSFETLAGRITYLELTPFDLSEIADKQMLWMRGGYPLSLQIQTRLVCSGAQAILKLFRARYSRAWHQNPLSAT
jgi:uncharacterized protein